MLFPKDYTILAHSAPWQRSSPWEVISTLLTAPMSLEWSRKNFKNPGISCTQSYQFFSSIPYRMWFLCPCKYLGSNVPRTLCMCNSSCLIHMLSSLSKLGAPGSLSNLLIVQCLAQVLAESTLNKYLAFGGTHCSVVFTQVPWHKTLCIWRHLRGSVG